MKKWVSNILLLFSLFPLTAQEKPSFFEYEVVYSSLPMYNLKGGLHQGLVYMDNVDITTRFNIANILNWEQDLSLFVYGLGNHGGQMTDLMGDFQVASNIQAPQSWRIFEFWLQQNLLNDKLSLLAGLYDLNSEFDVLRPATIFINSSFGIGAEYAQTGLNGPSIFPVSSASFRVSTIINHMLKLKLAVMDAVPGNVNNPQSNRIRLNKEEGALIAGEISIYPTLTNSISLNRGYVTRRKKVGRAYGIVTQDKINIGGWAYTSTFQQIRDSSLIKGNRGIYIGAQKYIFYSKYDDRYVALFGRFGASNAKINRLGSSVSGGLLFAGSRSELTDYIGVGFTTAINGRQYQDEFNYLEASETAIEITFSTPIRRWLTLQPDLQYVIHPNSDNRIENPLSAGLLIQVSL